MILDTLIQYDNSYAYNTIFTQQINKFIYLKSYPLNTHVRFYFITRIIYCLGIRFDFIQLLNTLYPP